MKQQDFNSKEALEKLYKERKSALYLTILCGIALVMIAVVYTLGWFSNNRTVTVNGVSVAAYSNAYSVYYHVVSDGESDNDGFVINGTLEEIDTGYWNLLDNEEALDFTQFIHVPGDSVTFRILVVNNSQGELIISRFGFDRPTDEERKPSELKKGDWDYDPKGNNTYYLGTQLQVGLLNDSYSKVTYDTAVRYNFLDEQVLLFETQDVEEGIHLPNNERTVFKVHVLFTNKFNSNNLFDSTLNQGAYKGFADRGGICKRRLYIEY